MSTPIDVLCKVFVSSDIQISANLFNRISSDIPLSRTFRQKHVEKNQLCQLLTIQISQLSQGAPCEFATYLNYWTISTISTIHLIQLSQLLTIQLSQLSQCSGGSMWVRHLSQLLPLSQVWGEAGLQVAQISLRKTLQFCAAAVLHICSNSFAAICGSCFAYLLFLSTLFICSCFIYMYETASCKEKYF